MSNNIIPIDYYSDVLCVWAWIAQHRLDELNKQLGDKIEFRYHYLDVFGDTALKMNTQWAERGHYKGFAQHVIESAAGFNEVTVNPAIWSQVRPTTSANAHLFLKATELSFGIEAATAFALRIRQAFFLDAEDIGQFTVLFDLLQQQKLEKETVNQAITNGTAIAALMSDYKKAKQHGIKGSPSYQMDNGRQTLYGNVGYRILNANIEELLKNPADEASWC